MQTVRPVPATRRRGAGGLAGKVRTGAAALGAGALILFGAAAPAVAADGTWYVDQANGADGPGCGVEPAASACTTIDAALDQAAAEDTIVIAPGTYSEALAIDSSITLEGTEGAVLVSDGSGPALSAEGEVVEVSVTGLTISPDPEGNQYAVVADGGSTVELSQVNIEHTPGATELGPGVRAQNFSSVVLTDSTVLAASPTPEGVGDLRGGVDAINGGDLTITRSTISPAGGQIYAGVMLGQLATDPGAPSTLTMTESVVSAGDIANVAIFQGSATIEDTSIPASETANPPGGYGVIVGDGSLDLVRSVITDHPMAGVGTFGLAGPFATVQVAVDDTTISGNGTQDRSQSGGIVVLGADDESGGLAGSLDVTNADLIGNSTGIVTNGLPTTVTNSTISGSGSGIVAQDADLSVTQTQLVGDGSNADQSDIGVRSANDGDEEVTLTVTDTEISNYLAGLSASEVRTIVSTSTISGNSAAGIMMEPGGPLEVAISDTEIIGNGALAAGALGGGLLIGGGEVTVTGATIADNVNGMILASGSVTLADSSVTGSGVGVPEDVPGAGFGIVAFQNSGNPEAEFTITGSEISGNRAGMGLGRSTVVRNSTIADNTWYGIIAGAEGLGTTINVALSASTLVGNGTEPMPQSDAPPSGLGIGPNAEVLVAGSILASSSAGAACDIDDSAGPLIDGGYNVVSDASCAVTEESSLAEADPLLGPLGDHGGTTNTAMPALDSPAVDLIPVGSTAAGSDLELCLEGSTDQRGAGFARPVGQACDAGAVETAFEPAQITTESLPGGTVDESYSATLQATDGAGEPYSWAVTEGELPDGLELNEETGEISGTPAADGSFTFTVQVDGEGTAEFTVTIAPAEVPAPVITTEALPDGIVGQSYTALVEATGGDGEPYAWAVTSGELPGGLELNAATGEIIGEPTEAGTFEFTIQVDGVTSAAFSVTVLPELVIVTDTLPQGTVGEPYTATLEATGGDGGPYTWGIDSGDLPDGLELNAATGEITGTPTTAESYTFTVVVGDPVYQEFTIEVVPAEPGETPPPEETDPPEETAPPTDAPDQPGDETPGDGPGPDDAADIDDAAETDGAELAVSGSEAPWGALALAALVVLMGGLLLVLRNARRLGLDR